MSWTPSLQQILCGGDLALHHFENLGGPRHRIVAGFAEERFQPDSHRPHRVAVPVAEWQDNRIDAIAPAIGNGAVGDRVFLRVSSRLIHFGQIAAGENLGLALGIQGINPEGQNPGLFLDDIIDQPLGGGNGGGR